MTSEHYDRPGGGGLLFGAGAVLLMALCCALPLLIAGGVLAGVGGLLGNPWVIGAGIALVALVLLVVARRRAHHGRTGPDCCPTTVPAQPADPKDDQNR